jgi:hypothetical protein
MVRMPFAITAMTHAFHQTNLRDDKLIATRTSAEPGGALLDRFCVSDHRQFSLN